MIGDYIPFIPGHTAAGWKWYQFSQNSINSDLIEEYEAPPVWKPPSAVSEELKEAEEGSEMTLDRGIQETPLYYVLIHPTFISSMSSVPFIDSFLYSTMDTMFVDGVIRIQDLGTSTIRILGEGIP